MREQIQRLNKTPGTEVSQGVLSSGVTQTPSMPFVQQQKTKGQRLAETFGVFTEGVTKITGAVVQDINAKEQAYQAIEGNADGVKYSQEVIDQARELPLEQQSAFIRNRMETRLDEMRKTDVSQSYLKAYIGSFMNGAGNFDAAVNKQVWQNKKAETLTKTVSLIQQSRLAGESHSQIMSNIMNANDIDRATAGELYTNSMAMFIKEQAQLDPSYDWQEAIDTQLKITSEDGAVNYATHPTYGKIIDNLESSLTTLQTVRTTADDKKKKQIAINTTKDILATAYNSNASAEEIAAAKATLEANRDIFTVEQYKTANRALETVMDNTGFASKSNPVTLAKHRANASTGKLTLDTLELLKGTMTQSEYTTVANDIIKFENNVVGTGKKALADGINDLEKSGVKLVAKTDLLGGFLEDNGPIKANAFSTQWNAYLIDYQETNEGQLPSFTEAAKKQQEIADAINKSYNSDNVGQAWGTQVSDVRAMSVDEIVKSGDVQLLQEAVKNKVINEKQTETAKNKILNTGTRKQIEDALKSGFIKIEDLKPVGDQASNAPIGIGTKAQAADIYEFDAEQMKKLENDARALLGEENWKDVQQFFDTAQEFSMVDKSQGSLVLKETATRLGLDSTINLDRFADLTADVESNKNTKALNKKTSAAGAFQFVKGSVLPALNRMKRFGLPGWAESLYNEYNKGVNKKRHQELITSLTYEQQKELFLADITQKTIDNKEGYGDSLISKIATGDVLAMKEMYAKGHHTDVDEQTQRRMDLFFK